jgi:hypothetical protein
VRPEKKKDKFSKVLKSLKTDGTTGVARLEEEGACFNRASVFAR